jgi:hypothetical protein
MFLASSAAVRAWKIKLRFAPGALAGLPPPRDVSARGARRRRVSA